MTDDNLLFEVKGVIHPKERIIAYLRYIQDKHGDRQSRSGTRFRKVYNLKEREEILHREYPQYLWLDENRGRQFQAVPRDRVSFVLSPIDGLRQLLDMGTHVTGLERASLTLAELLVELGGIEWSDVGLTGSQLVGLSSQKSDIDLVVYGSEPARRIHSVLRDKFDSFAGLERYHGIRLKKHVQFRWDRHNQWEEALQKIESKKVLQGLFRSYDFFIRMVKLPDEIEHMYEDLIIRDKGIQTVKCVVLDDTDSIFTPCIYTIESDMTNLQRLISFRGRFTEQVFAGESVEARGRMETVTNVNTDESFTQLVLGEDPWDYLMPTQAIQKS
ncbi:MAG: nucleotidyltransferase domain-containing protein [Candidatus Hermodarchaeota archaeon]